MPGEVAGGARARILIVDDDDEVRDTVRDVLLDAGYDVACACDGAEALRALAERPPPELLLVDLVMPGVDGHDLLGVLARDPQLAAIEVVVFSALPARQLPAGYAHVPKPTAIGDLLAAIEEALRGPTRRPP